MSELSELGQSLLSKSVGEDQASTPQVDLPVAYSAARQKTLSIPQECEQLIDMGGRQSRQDYIASLGRSFQQMKDGDVQPVREGLEELRRELVADAEDNSVDK